jgi:hypothetical protein
MKVSWSRVMNELGHDIDMMICVTSMIIYGVFTCVPSSLHHDNHECDDQKWMTNFDSKVPIQGRDSSLSPAAGLNYCRFRFNLSSLCAHKIYEKDGGGVNIHTHYRRCLFGTHILCLKYHGRIQWWTEMSHTWTIWGLHSSCLSENGLTYTNNAQTLLIMMCMHGSCRMYMVCYSLCMLVSLCIFVKLQHWHFRSS